MKSTPRTLVALMLGTGLVGAGIMVLETGSVRHILAQGRPSTEGATQVLIGCLDENIEDAGPRDAAAAAFVLLALESDDTVDRGALRQSNGRTPQGQMEPRRYVLDASLSPALGFAEYVGHHVKVVGTTDGGQPPSVIVESIERLAFRCDHDFVP